MNKVKEVINALDGMKTLTPAQIELGAQYLAMSNICTLDQFRREIVDLPSMKRAVQQAWDMAVTGGIEGYSAEAGKGYDDRFETKAINDVEKEIRGFRADLKAGGERSKYYIETLKKEVPFFFTDPSINKVIKVTAKKYEGDDKYSWAVFRSDRAEPCYTGLGRNEVAHYKKMVEGIIKQEQSR
jgi:hypothetical protein